MNRGVLYALLAAATFGASTPFSKFLAGQIAPVTLAGLLYFGSGLGLLAWFLIRLAYFRNVEDASSGLKGEDLPWLTGAILFGGIAGPVLLMVGLIGTPASSASLLLNMEGVLTSLLAWFVFKENFDRQIFLGMLLIVAGGVFLTWERRPDLGIPWDALAIVGACVCWAIDNNLTRKVSASDAVQIAGIKGLIAGVVNLTIAYALGFTMPHIEIALTAGIVGFCGYGLSLVLFVLALRNLGTARTGAYFSIAPFVGATLSLAILGDSPGTGFWIAGALMAAGIVLHLTENHRHAHSHLSMSHAHEHFHDDHHQHKHDFPWNARKSHAHTHFHESTEHSHPHVPDIHHRHQH